MRNVVEIVNPQDAVRGGGEGEGCTKPGGGVRDGVCGVAVSVDQVTWMQGGLASRGVNRHGNAVELVDKEKELATERRQGAAMAAITGEAIRQIAEERDAAREELARVRAELDEARQCAVQSSAEADVLRTRLGTANQEKAQARANALTYLANQGNLNMRLERELEDARAELERVVQAVRFVHAEYEGRCVSCEERCDCLDLDDMALVGDCTHGNAEWPCTTIQQLNSAPEANPATTAEPAAREVTLAEAAQQARLNLIEAEQRRIAEAEPDDEPKATCSCIVQPFLAPPRVVHLSTCEAKPAREQCEQVDCHNFGGWQDVCGTGPLFTDGGQ